MGLNGEISDDGGILLYEPRFIDPSLTTGLWWCETIDDVKAYGINCVCLSALHGWDEVKQAKGWLSQFMYIFVVSTNREFIENIRRYVPGMYILSVNPEAMKGCTSLRQYVTEHGTANVEELLYGANHEPTYGILELAKVDASKYDKRKRTLSNLVALDRYTGGFREGELIVVTGKRGEGKSSFMSQILLEALSQGERVMAYSGELPSRQFKNWALIQAAGPRHLEFYDDPEIGERIFFVPDQVAKKIDEWWATNYFLSDINAEYCHDEDTILANFEYVKRIYNCSVFLVDNVMTARLTGDRDFFRAQSKFAQRLARFAKANGVQVFLVAHPRKVQRDQAVTDGDDISGSGDLANVADTVLSVRRVPEEERQKEKCDCIVYVLKCRSTGKRGKVGLSFDPISKRFYPLNGNRFKDYCGLDDWRP